MTLPLALRSRCPPTMPRHGMAALTVVMLLFFVMALVAAYTNRNLIFEQRISANTYRVARALNAADGGVEWAVAMLNGGRVDANCQPSTNAANSDVRRRYLTDDDLTRGIGGYGLVTGADVANQMFPACISRDGALNCICPSTADRNPAISLPGDGSAFAVAFIPPGSDVRPGMIEITTRGCASTGSGSTACYAQARDTPQVDALSGALATLGLVRALPLAPIAALTAGTTIDASAGELRLANGDPDRALTAYAGGAIIPSGAGTDQFVGPAGSTGDSRRSNDTTLSQLAPASLALALLDNAWFRSMFGMPMPMFQRMPATRLISCAAGCTTTDLTGVVAGYPRNPIFLAGNLNLDSVANLGSDADPVMLVVNGTLTVSADVRITGFVHANSIVWSAGGATVKGAMASATSFTTSARATLAYDRSVMDLIQWRYGSFVRAPGSWNLTTEFGLR